MLWITSVYVVAKPFFDMWLHKKIDHNFKGGRKRNFSSSPYPTPLLQIINAQSTACVGV